MKPFFLLLSLLPILALAGEVRVENNKDGVHFAASNYHPDINSTLHSTMKLAARNRTLGLVARGFVDAHNKVRVPLGLPPLVWDKKVARFARHYALKMATTANCALEHSDGPYGENILLGGGPQWQPKFAIEGWVSEAKDYDVKSNTCAGGKICGHYTQVVWRDSLRLGCGQAWCPAGNLFVICNYDPPGNYIGARPY